MSKPKLIVLEGPDNVGKSTKAKQLVDYYDGVVVRQPSEDNSVGFLRQVVKFKEDIDPFARQLLHTTSHVVDVFEKFDHKRTIIMDRCHLSAFIYGSFMGIPQDKLDIMMNIHRKVYANVIDNYDVYIFNLSTKTPLESNDNSVYEKLNWAKLQKSYKDLWSNPVEIFGPNEKHFLIEFSFDESPDEVFQKIISKIED